MGHASFWETVRERGRNFFTNWGVSDAPFLTKLGVTLRNRTKALFSRQQCCGHHGQPGC